MNINDRPTPESDSARLVNMFMNFPGDCVPLEHARRLERKLATAIEAVEQLIATSNWPKACEQARATLDAIKAS